MAVPLGSSKPLIQPIYQSSVYHLPDLDALDRVILREEPGYIYARDGHPNARSLAEHLAKIENAEWALIHGSGMSSVSAGLLGLVSSGDRIIASNRLYGRTNQLLRLELARLGVKTTFVDCNNLEQVKAAFAEPAKCLFVETISNPLLRVVDLPALAELAHQHSCRLFVDNTFVSPAVYRPLEHGADLVMESLTKMIGGHSDVTLGVLAGKEPELLAKMSQITSIWGLASNPFDCWLAQRGLATLELRMKAATQNAIRLADWLGQQKQVQRVIYPGRKDHPDFALAQRLFPDGPANMLCFELAGEGRAAVNSFMRSAIGIPFSPSLGDTTTTISHPATTSHRYESPEEKQSQGITNGLVRVSVGIEPFETIQAEFSRGFC